MKIAIVTDSTAYLTEKEIKDNNINILAIPFIIDNKIYKEGISINNKEFFKLVGESKEFPSTTQPSIGETLELYEKLKKDGYDTIIAIHLSSTISGYVKNISNLNSEFENMNIYVYDSKITARLMGKLAIKASEMAKEQKEVDEIIKTLDKLRNTMDEYFIVDDLKNLVAGGRLSNSSAILGTLLKIKPILTFDEQTDYIVPYEKIRSLKKAMNRVEQIFKDKQKEIDYPLIATIYHTDDIESGMKWKEIIENENENENIKFEFAEIGPVVGVHLGRKALALSWMQDIDSI